MTVLTWGGGEITCTLKKEGLFITMVTEGIYSYCWRATMFWAILLQKYSRNCSYKSYLIKPRSTLPPEQRGSHRMNTLMADIACLWCWERISPKLRKKVWKYDFKVVRQPMSDSLEPLIGGTDCWETRQKPAFVSHLVTYQLCNLNT